MWPILRHSRRVYLKELGQVTYIYNLFPARIRYAFFIMRIRQKTAVIYINNCPTRCNTKQSIYYSASSLYTFRLSTTTIIRSTQNCNYSLRYWSYFLCSYLPPTWPRLVKVKQSHYRPGKAQRVLRKLRFPDFVTTAQDGGRLSALRTGRLYTQEMFLVLISVRG